MSGGGDSVALVRLLLACVPKEKIIILHFNHNLRAGAARDMRLVEGLADGFDLSCVVGHWAEKPRGNVPQSARLARYAFFAEAMQRVGVGCLLTAHTQSDVVENFFMRLGRGSGLQGLTGLAQAKTQVGGVQVVRPLLTFTRDELRHYLKAVGQKWAEDPTNDDETYLRPRVRKVLDTLAEVGLGEHAVAASVASLARAEGVLAATADAVFADMVRQEKSCLFIFPPFLTLPDELALRLVGRVIEQLAPAPMLPRTSARLALIERIRNGEKSSLGGVEFVPDKLGITAKPITLGGKPIKR